MSKNNSGQINIVKKGTQQFSFLFIPICISIGYIVVSYLVATFVRSGYQTRQEVIFDLFLFFGTSQNLTNPKDEMTAFSDMLSSSIRLTSNIVELIPIELCYRNI